MPSQGTRYMYVITACGIETQEGLAGHTLGAGVTCMSLPLAVLKPDLASYLRERLLPVTCMSIPLAVLKPSVTRKDAKSGGGYMYVITACGIET